MSKLSTLLELGVLAAQASRATSTEQLRRQGATAAAIDAIVQSARQEVFQINEIAKNILALEPASLLQAAGAMQLLQMRLDASGLTPEFFTELSDKTYVANTIRSVHGESKRLMSLLDSTGKRKVGDLVEAVPPLPEYSYYVDNWSDVQRYREAVRVPLSTSAGWAGFLGPLGLLGGCGWTALTSMCALSVSDLRTAIATIVTFVLPGLLLMGGSLFLLLIYLRAGRARAVIDEVKNKVDLANFNRLDRKFEGDVERVKLLRDQAALVIRDFFGDLSFSS